MTSGPATVPSSRYTNRASRHVAISTWGAAHLAGATAIVILFVDGIRPWAAATHVALSASFVVTVCLATLLLIRSDEDGRQGFAQFRVGPWYVAWATLAYGLASFSWVVPQSGAVSSIEQASVAEALEVFGVAMAAWAVGYTMFPLRPLSAFAERLLHVGYGPTGASLKVGAALPWMLYAAGMSARVALALLNGRIGYVGDASSTVSTANGYTQVLSSTSSLATFAIAVAGWRVFVDRRRNDRWTLLLLLCIELAAGAALGMKENFVVAGLAVLVPYGVAKGKIPLRPIIIMGLTFLLLVMPFNAAYRNTVRSGGSALSTSDALAQMPKIFEQVVSPSSWSETFSTSYNAFLERVRAIDNIAMIVQKTPEAIPYKPVSEYAAAPFVGLIPRSIWPGKPVMASGYEFSQVYFDRPSWLYTSSAITNVGDLFMHGGWAACVVGAFLLGCGFRLFDFMIRSSTDVRAVFFTLVFLPLLVKSEMDISGLLVSVPTGVFTAIIGIRLSCLRRQSKPLGMPETQPSGPPL